MAAEYDAFQKAKEALEIELVQLKTVYNQLLKAHKKIDELRDTSSRERGGGEQKTKHNERGK